MEQKKEVKPLRNKEKSKQKFLDAVEKILHTKGFSGLKVNDIARTAGLDKKLIYNYFGGKDELIDEYIRSQDFWSNVKDESGGLVVSDGGKTFAKAMLLSQFDYVFKNKDLQKILLWGLVENRKSLKKLANDREENGARLFESITDPHFKENAKRYRAIIALLISGIYYLDIYATTNDCTFCGLDLKTTEGRSEIEDALSFLIDKTYE
ncbi:TetR/AcrR family transcriptional regulator [Pedobacter sp. KBS0701]|uniref:TetR/AcrR family transcriptional regulator n=2 Tax=unclassified Pedobacter TaxID=2628915 RepID=UPI00110E82C7|nr:TetR/AcrR family transcriptional regulator [Pedobacter sp. KBS0701]QDW23999.1 TetR/AcrR family transcriptional regulator [Pedobacter sp. KBS0701]